jgi:hypothetical protein
MAVSFFGILILLMLCIGFGFAAIKAPKASFAIVGILVLLALPMMLYLGLQPHRASVAVKTSAIEMPVPQVRGPIIVSFDEQADAPSTQPSGKAWVDDWGQYVSSGKGNRSQLRAGTTSPWGSEEQARREARRQASAILLSRVSPHVRTTGKLLIGRDVVNKPQWLQQQLEQSLIQGQFIADEYVQRTEHSYGETWTCQLLLDASQPTITRAAAGYNQLARQQMESSAITWGGLAGLTVVTVLLYAFLNSVTKGYFMWRLRAAAAMIVLIAVLVVMSVA